MKSGNKILFSKTLFSATCAIKALRVAAYGDANSKSHIEDGWRKMRARLGARKAIAATAYKCERGALKVL